MTKILVIPDVQIRPGDDTKFLRRIGQYIVDKRPDRLICLGDFADMASLSSYDRGKKSFEGRRYTKDVIASQDAMAVLLTPLIEHNANAKKNHKPRYWPDMHMFLGNHEYRTVRAVEEDPKLEGVLDIEHLKYKEFGWKVYPFLEVAVIDGIAFSHYFVTGVAGRPASSAEAQLRKTNMSCIAGHQQGLKIHMATRADGARLTSIIAGSCYEHNEDYLGAQGNRHWRGVLMLHEVVDGSFDHMPVSLDYLKGRYPE